MSWAALSPLAASAMRRAGLQSLRYGKRAGGGCAGGNGVNCRFAKPVREQSPLRRAILRQALLRQALLRQALLRRAIPRRAIPRR
ncbi:MAG: hypothetical protein ACTHLV_17540, partial [Achromobacter mucicolens]